MNVRRPWRRDAVRWASTYGLIAVVVSFGFLAKGEPLLPADDYWHRLNSDAVVALASGAACFVIVLVARFSGSLLDLDELDAVGRGGLGLIESLRARERKASKASEPSDDDDTAA